MIRQILQNWQARLQPAQIRAGWVRLAAAICLAGLALAATGCAKIKMPVHLKPLSSDMMRLMAAKKMRASAPVFIRIFKTESELEVWKQREDGRYYHLKTYPICAWSGTIGPKHRQGDKQAPEGFYTINRHQMNPNSKFHLAFDLGFPNRYDRAHGRTGNFLMVHGDCTSAGCYAMTDHWIEEIYALAREAFIGGQGYIHVHAFPFRPTEENMSRHARNKNIRFWRVLKQGYDAFQETRLPPPIVVCRRRYVVNVVYNGPRPDPLGACPRFRRPEVAPFTPMPAAHPSGEEQVVAKGPKRRFRTASGEVAPYEAGESVTNAVRRKKRQKEQLRKAGKFKPGQILFDN